MGNGDMRVFGGQHDRNATDRLFGDVIQGQIQGDRLAGVQLMVVVAHRVVDLIGIIPDSTQLNGFNCRSDIDTAKAKGVALAIAETDSGFFKDAAHVGGHQVGVFAQHQGHAACRTRRGHRSAAHRSVPSVTRVVQRLDVDTRGAHIGTDEADAWVVGIVAKLSVAPCDRAARSEIGRRVIVINSTNTHRAGQVAGVLALDFIHIRRRAAARHTHVVGNRILPCAIAFVACCNSGHHTSV